MAGTPHITITPQRRTIRWASSGCILGVLCGLLCGPGLVHAATPAIPAPEAGRPDTETTSHMVRLPGGTVRLPFRPPADDTATAPPRVQPFLLDTRAVTVDEYAAFVRRNPRYARPSIPRPLADDGYLRTWSADGAPPLDDGERPVTAVSWYAAKAFCADVGKRLPTTLEWEYAAATSPAGSGADSAARESLILAWYARSAAERLPAIGSGSRHAYGIGDLYGVVWEWTADYNAWTGAGINRRGRADANESAEGGLFCGGGSSGMIAGVPYATYMRWAFRASLKPEYTVGTLGFRCARDATPEQGD